MVYFQPSDLEEGIIAFVAPNTATINATTIFTTTEANITTSTVNDHLQLSTIVVDEVSTDERRQLSWTAINVDMLSFFIYAAAEALLFIQKESLIYKAISGDPIFRDIANRQDEIDIQFTDLIRGYCSQKPQKVGYRHRNTECSGGRAFSVQDLSIIVGADLVPFG